MMNMFESAINWDKLNAEMDAMSLEELTAFAEKIGAIAHYEPWLGIEGTEYEPSNGMSDSHVRFKDDYVWESTWCVIDAMWEDFKEISEEKGVKTTEDNFDEWLESDDSKSIAIEYLATYVNCIKTQTYWEIVNAVRNSKNHRISDVIQECSYKDVASVIQECSYKDVASEMVDELFNNDGNYIWIYNEDGKKIKYGESEGHWEV